ncbi:MAG: TIGR02757 family protein [Deferribacteraceae bacterium]|jgi:uncharacterized protein (TIGR02757 family)|nr:TIGR02757 family protein [Deferribacteraceae bacterium]
MLLSPFLEHLYAKYNTQEYIKTDPIFFPHTFDGNREFIAFTSALFAYGNVKAMQNFLKEYFNTAGVNPLELEPKGEIKYRFQSAEDVREYSAVMKKLYKDYASIENLFLLSSREGLYNAAERAFYKIHSDYLPKKKSHGLNFLFAVPNRSASKRVNMFLRWMLRSDEVDLGLWKGGFNKSELSIPLDTHIQRLCGNLGVIGETEKASAALKKVNAFFAELSPDDPAKYDFALTRLGITMGCQYRLSLACTLCEERGVCAFKG